MIRRTVITAVLALFLLAVPAGAAAPQWAAVNVCADNQVGIRASIPGDLKASTMAARFYLQWFSSIKGNWVGVRGASTSPWRSAGSAAYEWAQEGWTFRMATLPPRGAPLRGVVKLRWLDGDRLARSRTLITRGGVGGAGSCALRR